MCRIREGRKVCTHNAAAQDAPFRQLLASRIALRYEVDHQTAAEVDDLVRYYKFKARYHRPAMTTARHCG